MSLNDTKIFMILSNENIELNIFKNVSGGKEHKISSSQRVSWFLPNLPMCWEFMQDIFLYYPINRYINFTNNDKLVLSCLD